MMILVIRGNDAGYSGLPPAFHFHLIRLSVKQYFQFQVDKEEHGDHKQEREKYSSYDFDPGFHPVPFQWLYANMCSMAGAFAPTNCE